VTRSRRAALGLLLAVSTLVTAAGGGARAAQAPEVTFNRDVAPILYARCVGCHRPGESAPMSLLTYESARPWARAIRARVAAREMPPWPAAAPRGRFRNEHTLTDTEIATLLAWADNDAPRGEGQPPAPPRFQEGWSSGIDRPPDVVIDAPEFALPASGVIPEFRVWARQPFGSDRLIEAIELRPTNRVAVHHASVFRAKLPRGARVGTGPAWPDGPTLEGIPVGRNGLPIAETRSVSFGTPLVFYVPAGGFLRFPQGVAKRIARDEYLMWTFHLVTSGREGRAGARVGIWFSRGDVTHEVVTWTVTDRLTVDGVEVPRDRRGPIYPPIAAHDPDYVVTGQTRLREPVTVYALWPHMHYRGREMTFSVVDRNGREETLLHVPRYRFDWQFTYHLATPLKVAAGSTLKAVARYDNSARNPDNPDPSQEVAWGPQASDEMFDPFVELVYDRRPLRGSECEAVVMRRESDAGPGFLSPCP
jgi:hypothetical protein